MLICCRIAAHGLRWLDIGELSVEEEKNYIKECALSLERTTGKFPKGYFYGRASPNIRGLYPEVMKEMGKKLLYSSESCFNDDVPYWVDLPWEKDLPEQEREGMLIIPYNYDCNGKSPHLPHPLLNLSLLTSPQMENFICPLASLEPPTSNI